MSYRRIRILADKREHTLGGCRRTPHKALGSSVCVRVCVPTHSAGSWRRLRLNYRGGDGRRPFAVGYICCTYDSIRSRNILAKICAWLPVRRSTEHAICAAIRAVLNMHVFVVQIAF